MFEIMSSSRGIVFAAAIMLFILAGYFVSYHRHLLAGRLFPIAFVISAIAFFVIVWFIGDILEVKFLHLRVQPKNWSAFAALLSTAYLWIFFPFTICLSMKRTVFPGSAIDDDEDE